MDYPGTMRTCATCNRWTGKRQIINPLDLPNFECVRCEEVSVAEADAELIHLLERTDNSFVAPASRCESKTIPVGFMACNCKNYSRWNKLEVTLFDEISSVWNSRWCARREFKESKMRDLMDYLVLKGNYNLLRGVASDNQLVSNMSFWLYEKIANPISTLMYRLKMTTQKPVEIYDFDPMEELMRYVIHGKMSDELRDGLMQRLDPVVELMYQNGLTQTKPESKITSKDLEGL